MKKLRHMALLSVVSTVFLWYGDASAQMPLPRTLSLEKINSSELSVDKIYFLAYKGQLFERPGRKMVSPSSEGITIFNVPEFIGYLKKSKQPIVNKKFDGAIERLQNIILYSENNKDYAYALEIISYGNSSLANKAIVQGTYPKDALVFNISQFNLIFTPQFSSPDNYAFIKSDLQKIFPTIKQVKK